MAHLPIDSLKGLTDGDRATMARLGIISPEGLSWTLVNDPTIAGELDATDSTATGRVISAAAGHATRRAGSVAVRRIRDHLMDIVIALIVIAILFGISRKGLWPPRPQVHDSNGRKSASFGRRPDVMSTNCHSSSGSGVVGSPGSAARNCARSLNV
jgi:hypothetical protein